MSATIENFPLSWTFVCDKCGGKFHIVEQCWCSNGRKECIICNYKTAYQGWMKPASKEEYKQEIQKRIDKYRDYDRILKEHGYFEEEFLEQL